MGTSPYAGSVLRRPYELQVAVKLQGREACRLEDAVFSREPNWVERRFMFVTQSSYSFSLDWFLLPIAGVLA